MNFKRVARAVLHRGGGLGGFRRWNRNAVRILMYHNFSPAQRSSLAAQCEHLTRHYRVVTLTDVAESLQGKKRLPPNAAAVTVDDGYGDFLNAYPVFHAYGIPVTVFLVSGFLDRKLWMWWDKVAWLFERSPRPSVELPLAPGAEPARFALDDAGRRRRAAAAVAEAAKALTLPEHRRLMERLPALLEADLPSEPPEPAAPLEWAEVRKLSQDSVEFGAHTLTHPILSKLTDADELHREIWGSKRRIEQEVRRPVVHFCYPNGLAGDFNGETVKAVDQCMFRTAVTTVKGLNDPRRADPFRLRRVPVEASLPLFYFKELLAGLHAEG